MIVFMWPAGMIAMKETLAQLPADHFNARKLAEGTAHRAIQTAWLLVCLLIQRIAHIGNP